MDLKGALKEFVNLNSMHLNEKLWKRKSSCISNQCKYYLVNKYSKTLQFIENNLENLNQHKKV